MGFLWDFIWSCQGATWKGTVVVLIKQLRGQGRMGLGLLLGLLRALCLRPLPPQGGAHMNGGGDMLLLGLTPMGHMNSECDQNF